MIKMRCEEVLIQKMALADGEVAGLSGEEIDAHLAACESCRRESERLESAALLLARQKRRAPDADLWSAVEKRIAGSEAGFAARWQPFLMLGALLVVYKLIEMMPESDPGWALKLVPLVLVAAVFGLLKENPFKINTELILEK